MLFVMTISSSMALRGSAAPSPHRHADGSAGARSYWTSGNELASRIRNLEEVYAQQVQT